MKPRLDIHSLNEIPNVGPASVKYLNILDIHEPMALIGQDPYLMFEELCSITGKRFDPCLCDVFISAVKFMEGAPKKNWWDYSAERKTTMMQNK